MQWLVHWPLMGGLLHLVHRREDWAGAAACPGPSSLYQNVTAHPSTASVPTSYYSMYHYNCLWSLKGLSNFQWRCAWCFDTNDNLKRMVSTVIVRLFVGFAFATRYSQKPGMACIMRICYTAKSIDRIVAQSLQIRTTCYACDRPNATQRKQVRLGRSKPAPRPHCKTCCHLANLTALM